jgi:uncharacterized RDD family membrane protein YckC
VQLDDRITIATPEGVAIEVVLAGLGSRFLARLLDTLVQVFAIFALVLVMASVGDSGIVLAFGLVLVFLVVFAYDVAFEVLNHGRTIGKLVAGIRVVGDSGEPVRFLASAIRNIVRIVDFLPLFYLIGSVSIVATRHDQRLGDLAAGTVVARDRFPGLAQPPAPITVTPDLVATWDVSAIRPAEVHAVRQFLDRRLSLRWPARSYFAVDLANRLGPRVVGVPPNSHPEYVLEGIVVAKQHRT